MLIEKISDTEVTDMQKPLSDLRLGKPESSFIREKDRANERGKLGLLRPL